MSRILLSRLLRHLALPTLPLLLTACEPPPESSGLEAVYDGSRYQVRLQQQRISVFDHQLQETIFASPVSSFISAHQTTLSAPTKTATSKEQPLGLPLTTTAQSCTQAVVDKVETTRESLLLAGHFTSEGCSTRFNLNFALEADQLLLTMATTDETYNHLTLGFDAPLQETVFGFGSQASLLNFKGREVPVWSRQQGIGRGEQPISTLVEEQTPGAAGTDLNSDMALPYFLSSARYSVFLDHAGFSHFDFRQRHSTFIHSYTNTLNVRLTSCNQLLECISQYTAFSGRMAGLPEWTQQGAIVGLQGGSDKVLSHYQQLKDHQVPVAALWLKDWQQVTSDGQPRYPDWKTLRKTLQQDGVRLLGYVTPNLTHSTAPDLYQQARDKGYLLSLSSKASGESETGVVDLTNPDAFKWLKGIIKKQVKARQLAGWFADLPQPLPMEARLHNDQSPIQLNNLFAQEWARLNHEVISELKMSEEALLWMRSGFTNSPSLVSAFSAAEQNTSWDAHDGLQSAVVAMLNSGISGLSISHTDTGGYTSMQQAIPNLAQWLLPKDLTLPQTDSNSSDSPSFALHRSPELLQRWIELSALTGLLRTEEGLTPAINAQVYDSPELLEHFADNIRLFQALTPYRKELMQEASDQGWPLVRHPLLHFPNEQYFAKMPSTDLQFMLGESLMVAPMLTPVQQRQKRQVFLPKGEWIEVTTGKTILAGKKGKMLHINPPGNQAALYLQNNERSREMIIPALQQAGFIPAVTPPVAE
ncbi:hypothetical protein KOI40_08145 [Aestuariicella sp. G3-2]|uniref:TIM-barrel domain-containing protein n=1 Tax=Pseudomaricurvus albidus TaxID=2842452 RepID=UPI001C0B6D0F|nr:TIM-barrel domain-containing protein [Aestuariicella albida]MBU3069790.1 hypothetical protein [Aestuariicella albida]